MKSISNFVPKKGALSFIFYLIWLLIDTLNENISNGYSITFSYLWCSTMLINIFKAACNQAIIKS